MLLIDLHIQSILVNVQTISRQHFFNLSLSALYPLAWQVVMSVLSLSGLHDGVGHSGLGRDYRVWVGKHEVWVAAVVEVKVHGRQVIILVVIATWFIDDTADEGVIVEHVVCWGKRWRHLALGHSLHSLVHPQVAVSFTRGMSVLSFLMEEKLWIIVLLTDSRELWGTAVVSLEV